MKASNKKVIICAVIASVIVVGVAIANTTYTVTPIGGTVDLGIGSNALVYNNVVLQTAGGVIQLIQRSGASSTPQLSAFAGNPNGTVSCTKGDTLYDTSTPAIWQCSSGTTWTQIATSASVPALTLNADPNTGAGQNGSPTFDGTTTITIGGVSVAPTSSNCTGGATKCYSLTQNIYTTNATVNSGVEVKLNGWQWVDNGTACWTDNGVVDDNGYGTSARAAAYYAAPGSPGSPASGGFFPIILMPNTGPTSCGSAAGGGSGIAGSNGGCRFAGGGGGGCGTGVGTAGGSVSLLSNQDTAPVYDLLRIGWGRNASAFTLQYGPGVGGGGGCGASGANGIGGVGGGFAFVQVINACGTGVVSANGGPGEVAASGGGGGGGGGGGICFFGYQHRASGATVACQANGGSGGASAGGGGAAGGSGSAGFAWTDNQSGDGS
jgi:hypothetical protein